MSGGEAALHAASRSGLREVTKALLEGNADPLQRNAQGDTAYVVAQRAGRAECAELLKALSEPESSELAVDLFQEESEKTREKRQKKSRQREKKEKAPQKELSKEALQQRVTELRREKSRAMQKAKHLTRRIEEEVAKDRQMASQREELRQRSWELKEKLKKKQAEAEKAEVAARAAEEKVNALVQQRSEIHEEVSRHQKEMQLEAETLRQELSLLRQKKMGGSRSSYASCRHRRIAAEQRRKELQLELMAIARSLQAPEGLKQVPPLFLPSGAPEVRNAPLFRELYKQQQMHLAAMRELVAATSQQIHERETELDAELDVLLGSGLPKLLAALKAEGVITKCPELEEDPDRAGRLRSLLLK